ncbi:MAG: beta-galactosidase [Elainella sp.]
MFRYRWPARFLPLPLWAASRLSPSEIFPEVRFGTTFSQLQCRYLGLDYRDTFRQICGLGFDRIRLCAYWNEIEPQPNQFDFTVLDWLLEECDRQQIQVVLALGMKTPRWPEFHFPDWISQRHETGAGSKPLDQRSPALAEATLTWLSAVVQHLRHAPALAYWQIENEPFTRLEITGGRFLSPAFIRREVALLRELAAQPLLLTGSIALPSANAPEDEAALQDCLTLADAVGLNVYSKVPLGQTRYYLEPQPAFWQTLERWQIQIHQAQKSAWIAEAQAEPWEPH